MRFERVLTAEAEGLSPILLLDGPVSWLHGVSPEAVIQLDLWGIGSIVTLADSWLFANASRIVELARSALVTDTATAIAPLVVTSARNIPAGDVQGKPVSVLSGLGGGKGTAEFATALGVVTVRDLALWPPYAAACAIRAAANGSPLVDDASELVPRYGDMPTDVAYFDTLVLGSLDTTGAVPLTGVVDLMGASQGFAKPATGAVLTYRQSWTPRGLTLGALLHSVALAPGESTRLAIIDWTRTSSAAQTDDVSEQDSLTNTTTHARAMGEVQSATAREAQEGFSSLNSKATSESGGVSAGLAIGPFSLGGRYQRGTNTTSSSARSWSTGSRDLAASTAQHINDATSQAASSTRNRRASVVREVSQKEHEEISTRVVCNYNHMHALTMQYFETVQAYHVDTRLVRAERALFVPLAPLAFTDDEIRRYRFALAEAAFEPDVREDLLHRIGWVTITSGKDATVVNVPIAGPNAPAPAPAKQPDPPPTAHTPVPDGSVLVEIQAPFMPSGGGAIQLSTGETVTFALQQPIKHNNNTGVDAAHIKTIALDNPFAGPAPVVLNLIFDHAGVTVSEQIRALLQGGAKGQVVALFEPPAVVESIRQHVLQNKNYYESAVFSSLTGVEVTRLLSGYTYEDRPVLEVADPTPYTAAGNYLVLKMPAYATSESDVGHAVAAGQGQKTWETWLQDHDVRIGTSNARLVMLPTGGVFGEATLGRSNSGEQIDLTRFWNWQDSPIPLLAPDIAPVQAGQHQSNEGISSSGLGPSIISQASPVALPDPTGLGPMLQALQNGAMFRDMSGLSAVADLAKTTAQLANQAAASAGDGSGKALSVAADKEVALRKLDLEAKAAAARDAAAAAERKSQADANLAKADQQRDITGALTQAATAGAPPNPTVAGGIVNEERRTPTPAGLGIPYPPPPPPMPVTTGATGSDVLKRLGGLGVIAPATSTIGDMTRSGVRVQQDHWLRLDFLLANGQPAPLDHDPTVEFWLKGSDDRRNLVPETRIGNVVNYRIVGSFPPGAWAELKVHGEIPFPAWKTSPGIPSLFMELRAGFVGEGSTSIEITKSMKFFVEPAPANLQVITVTHPVHHFVVDGLPLAGGQYILDDDGLHQDTLALLDHSKKAVERTVSVVQGGGVQIRV